MLAKMYLWETIIFVLKLPSKRHLAKSLCLMLIMINKHPIMLVRRPTLFNSLLGKNVKANMDTVN